MNLFSTVLFLISFFTVFHIWFPHLGWSCYSYCFNAV